MSGTAAPKHEWLVIMPDFEGALEKRLSVRAYVLLIHYQSIWLSYVYSSRTLSSMADVKMTLGMLKIEIMPSKRAYLLMNNGTSIVLILN